ncbi:DUF6953 family protein [Paenibacillus hodogayensis]|uniref:DUF6953 family protein n=1 Tax=Paenibacillus hodogayensis TaxID=279208 RepID=A0ABV5VUD9_9BACL
MTMQATAEQVAEWMLEKVRFAGLLYQEEAVNYIRTNFGEQFIYVNENGNASIDKNVLKQTMNRRS